MTVTVTTSRNVILVQQHVGASASDVSTAVTAHNASASAHVATAHTWTAGQAFSGQVDITGKLNVGTVTGFSAWLQTGYINPSRNNIGLLNPSTFTQACLDVVTQDNTGNSQNAGLFGYEVTVPVGTTAAYGNGIEG
ncbi:MAG TPA: hypothetical protein VII92_03375, partial [Anaerolineae bacterium]